MRTALFIEDGLTQVVLTPETETDRAVLDKLQSRAESGGLVVRRGDFYVTRGGWTAYNSFGESLPSLMLRVEDTSDAPR